MDVTVKINDRDIIRYAQQAANEAMDRLYEDGEILSEAQLKRIFKLADRVIKEEFTDETLRALLKKKLKRWLEF